MSLSDVMTFLPHVTFLTATGAGIPHELTRFVYVYAGLILLGRSVHFFLLATPCLHPSETVDVFGFRMRIWEISSSSTLRVATGSVRGHREAIYGSCADRQGRGYLGRVLGFGWWSASHQLLLHVVPEV